MIIFTNDRLDWDIKREVMDRLPKGTQVVTHENGFMVIKKPEP